jgi:hypothetical protein
MVVVVTVVVDDKKGSVLKVFFLISALAFTAHGILII